ncbi:MAG: carbamoyltransferase HypF, partial [Chlorobiales bacterium]|nr:carbamoyltransferase HypF [Chlorobiales bacterium]
MAGRTGKTERAIVSDSHTCKGGKLGRLKVLVNGIVQGVGFRPFVYNLAHERNLSGFVTNTSGGVEIEVEGNPSDLNLFLEKLITSAPPLSVITTIQSKPIPTNGQDGFIIIPSKGDAKVQTLISPDMAVCPDCLKELFDPADRRHRYPFINCTNCGPRYTIIENIPYDRPATSMKHFKMCPVCETEYHNPTNRRFHAQPNACPVCGPQVSLYNPDREKIETTDPISETVRFLKAGYIVAIKGLGGFHLAVDARNELAVQELRGRKHREEKPFAVMARNIEIVNLLCELNEAEAKTLSSPQAPILLLQKKKESHLAESIAPGNDRLGIMLPYTPLHHVLLNSELDALVMTSANLSDEPICIENDEAFDRLSTIADYFLLHNRDIYLRCDDSVVIHLAGTVRQLRRSRGFAPRPIFVASEGPPVLAVGGELKNTVCLLKQNQAFLSQHIGDLENLEAYTHFQKTIGHLERIFETTPELVVHDLH